MCEKKLCSTCVKDTFIMYDYEVGSYSFNPAKKETTFYTKGGMVIAVISGTKDYSLKKLIQKFGDPAMKCREGE